MANDKIEAVITIFGGAAMALMHDERRTTDDIDASFSHSTDIQLLIFNMRDEYDFEN
ncbi:MAG: hypothetical protein LBP95_00865, partial [Deltaproteobacteria bacterium]|nr:hypothetical protein [Deltaproteobacteria bacterium]